MYKVYLVDDEKLVLKEMLTAVVWENYGFTVCGSSDSPLRALKEIGALAPDLVLSDISMRGMSGLKLAERCKAYEKRSYFCFVSAYDEFGYVKTAIDLNAIGYLLKPLDADELIGILHKVKSFIVETRNNAFFDMEKGNAAEIRARLGRLGIRCADGLFSVLVCETELPSLTARIELLACKNGLYYYLAEDFKPSLASADIGVSLPFTETAGLFPAVRQAESAMRARFVTGRPGVRVYKRLACAERIAATVRAAVSRNELLYLLREARPSVTADHCDFAGILTVYESVTSRASELLRHNVLENLSASAMMTRFSDVHALYDYMIRVLDEQQDTPDNAVIAGILEDLHKDLADALSLTEYAAKYGYNISWLSQLFIRYVGEPFVSYVVRLRVEEAKKLILGGGYSLIQIGAMVGYEDYYHFSKLFKKHTGYSPKAFKDTFCK